MPKRIQPKLEREGFAFLEFQPLKESKNMSNIANLELNKGDDFIICLDISASMTARDCPSGLSRYEYCLEQCHTFAAEASKWDTDGVSVYLFGASVKAYPDLPADQLKTKLSTASFEGATMTHLAIEKAFSEHKERKNEQTCVMLFTDGEPSDPDALFKTIAAITNELKDEKEFILSFITVGERSLALNQFLIKLDDNLPGAKYDIVDVKRLEEVDFYTAFDGALND